jgi:hypothetical protein
MMMTEDCRSSATMRCVSVISANISDQRTYDTSIVYSTIIDFDYYSGGVAGNKVYPPRFNPVIDDEYRHPGARAKKILEKFHDIAAVKWMCQQYQPKNVGVVFACGTCNN